MSWIVVALSAYLILAVANLLDKFLINTVLLSSKAYVFAASLMSLFIFIIAPWYLEWPGLFPFLFNILAGIIFAIALWFLYEALMRGETSRILVIIGGTTPIFSLIFSLWFFKEHFSNNQWLGMAALLAGVIIIAYLPQSRNYMSRVMKKLGLNQEQGRKNAILFAFLSALAYSLYFISSKYAYSSQPFLSSFIWTRLGSALFVSLFLLSKKYRKEIFNALSKKNPNKNKFLVIVNQGLGSLGFMLQNYAVFLGSVALVNALQGFQYAFLLVIGTVLALMKPKLLKETFSLRIVFQKSLAIVVIGLGIYFLTV